MSTPFLAFLSPGGSELLLILLALLLLFGPKDAPRMLRKLQQSLKKLKHMAADFQRTLMNSDLPDAPKENPADTQVYDEEKASTPPDDIPPPSPPPTDGASQ
jgi:Sec-independent protein translocase protein TatA